MTNVQAFVVPGAADMKKAEGKKYFQRLHQILDYVTDEKEHGNHKPLLAIGRGASTVHKVFAEHIKNGADPIAKKPKSYWDNFSAKTLTGLADYALESDLLIGNIVERPQTVKLAKNIESYKATKDLFFEHKTAPVYGSFLRMDKIQYISSAYTAIAHPRDYVLLSSEVIFTFVDLLRYKAINTTDVEETLKSYFEPYFETMASPWELSR